MRLKRSRIKEFYLKKKSVKKDREGNTYEEYGSPVPFSGEAWPASGKIQAEIYGNRLPYIYNMRINGKYEVVHNEEDKQVHYMFPDIGLDLIEGDGVCLFAEGHQDPDYHIISVKPHRFLRLEVERI